MIVEPGRPFEGCQFHNCLGFPRRRATVQLGFVQAVDRLGQCIVVAIAIAAHRKLDAAFGQASL